METSIAIIGLVGSIVASIIGGVIGGWLAIKASRIATAEAFNYSLKLQKQTQNQAIRGVLLGLRTEIDVLRFIYESEYSADEITSLKEGQAFEYHYPIHQNYFTVYEGNASLIGQIPDDEVRSLIIEIYLRIKGLIDTHLLNNELLNERDRLRSEDAQRDITEYSVNIDLAQKAVEDYGINIKVNYEGLVEALDKFYPKVESVIQKLSDDNDTKSITS